MSHHVLTIALAGLTICVAGDTAFARHRHRHHVFVERHQFVYPTPDGAARAGAIGEFAGEFVTGMPSATTADPYEHPAYGYNQRGVYGAGYVYPGY